MRRRTFLDRSGRMLTTAMLARLLPPPLAWAGAVPVAGSADWPRYGADIHNTRFNAAEKAIGPDNVGRLKPKWQFATEDGWPIQTTPTVVGDTVFFGAGRYYYSLNSATGRVNWKYDTGIAGDWIPTLVMRGIRSSADYRDGRIYFGDGWCTVRCVDASTGREVWKTRLQDDPELFATMMYSPVVHNGKVYVGFSSSMAEIACLDAGTGAVRWRFRVVKDVPERFKSGGGPLWTSGAIDEQQNVVFNGTGNAKAYMPAGPTLYANSVVAHDADTGELLWAYQAHPQDVNDLDFCAHPMVFDAVAPGRSRGDIRRCVAAGNKANLVCLNRHTGELFWKSALAAPSAGGGPHINSTAVAYNSVFIQNASPGSRPSFATTASLHAYTGDIQWIVPNPGLQSSPIGVANGVLYQGLLAPAKIEALDASSGERLWEFALPSQFRGGVSIANGAVYTSNGEPLGWSGEKMPYDHAVYCFTVDGR